MTARFLALYQAPADPEAFGRHYREVHIPLARQLPALRRYTLGGDAAAAGSHAASRTGDVACQRPADERVGVPVPHAMLGLQVPHDGHVLLEGPGQGRRHPPARSSLLHAFLNAGPVPERLAEASEPAPVMLAILARKHR
jgi:uncharacterized protein (TIGR02118 family)